MRPADVELGLLEPPPAMTRSTASIVITQHIEFGKDPDPSVLQLRQGTQSWHPSELQKSPSVAVKTENNTCANASVRVRSRNESRNAVVYKQKFKIWNGDLADGDDESRRLCTVPSYLAQKHRDPCQGGGKSCSIH